MNSVDKRCADEILYRPRAGVIPEARNYLECRNACRRWRCREWGHTQFEPGPRRRGRSGRRSGEKCSTTATNASSRRTTSGSVRAV